MKQFTTPDQTAKLIELGFKTPKIDSGVTKWEGYEPICTGSYSIGELIEILNRVDDEKLEICRDCGFWLVGTDLYCTTHRELVDALFDMIVLLKEEGVI